MFLVLKALLKSVYDFESFFIGFSPEKRLFAHIIVVCLIFSRLFSKKSSNKFVVLENCTTFALAFGNERGNAVLESKMILETIPYRQAVQRSLSVYLTKNLSVK